MIGHITGEILLVQTNIVTIGTTTGVSFEIQITKSEALDITRGEVGNFWTHSVYREDSQELYGFTNLYNRSVFRLLISMNGIGPKSAIAALDSNSPELIVQAIVEKNTNYLQSLPGIGKKTAEKMTIELEDKARDLQSASGITRKDNAVVEALQSFGYKESQIVTILTEIDTSSTIENQIKQALRILGSSK